MKIGKTEIARIKKTVQESDYEFCACTEHRFYIKAFSDRMMLVFAKKRETNDGFNIECFGYLKDRRESSSASTRRKRWIH